jgi:hypothetical protein
MVPANIPESMGPKPDGKKKYSRLTRRCVAILKHLPNTESFDLNSVAKDFPAMSYKEFLINIDKRRPLRPSTIRAYLAFLEKLKLVQKEKDGAQYSLAISKPTTDSHWAQVLSDYAREYSASLVHSSAANLPDFLQEKILSLYKSAHPPTLGEIMKSLEFEGPKQEETFRWCLYLYLDGDAVQFELLRNPLLVPRAAEV